MDKDAYRHDIGCVFLEIQDSRMESLWKPPRHFAALRTAQSPLELGSPLQPTRRPKASGPISRYAPQLQIHAHQELAKAIVQVLDVSEHAHAAASIGNGEGISARFVRRALLRATDPEENAER